MSEKLNIFKMKKNGVCVCVCVCISVCVCMYLSLCVCVCVLCVPLFINNNYYYFLNLNRMYGTSSSVSDTIHASNMMYFCVGFNFVLDTV